MVKVGGGTCRLGWGPIKPRKRVFQLGSEVEAIPIRWGSWGEGGGGWGWGVGGGGWVVGGWGWWWVVVSICPRSDVGKAVPGPRACPGVDWGGYNVFRDCYKVVQNLEHQCEPCVPTPGHKTGPSQIFNQPALCHSSSGGCRLPAFFWDVVIMCMV